MRAASDWLARRDLAHFAEALGYKNAPHHEEWYRLVSSPAQNIVLLGPRGYAKSTCGSINYPLWLIGRNPNIRIAIASNTVGQAELFVRQIRMTIEGSAQFNRLFPNLQPGKGGRWGDNEIMVNRPRVSKDATVTALGCGSPIIGRRFDIILPDDILDEENTRSAAQREKVKTWLWKTLYPTLEPDGLLRVYGTRWYSDDLYGELLKDPRFTGAVYGAITNLDGPKEEWRSLWPERWPLPVLLDRLNANRTMFLCQMMNNPTALGGNRYQQEWIQYVHTLPKIDRGVMACDLAVSTKTTADYFAVVPVGLGRDHNIYVLDAFAAKGVDFDSQQDTIKAIYSKWRPGRVVVEATAYQAVMARQLAKRTLLPIKEFVPQRDKVSRSIPIETLFSNRKVFIYRPEADGKVMANPHMDLLVSQLLAFPYGAHDDLPDALFMAIEDLMAGGRKAWVGS